MTVGGVHRRHLARATLLTLAIVSLLSACAGGQFTSEPLGLDFRVASSNNAANIMRQPAMNQQQPPVMSGQSAGNSNSAQNTALDQLVSFLTSINNQQQQTNNNNQRRSPALPLGLMNNQRQLGQPQPISSTPINPFVAAANFQPTRRQQQQVPQTPQAVQFPQIPAQGPNSQPLLTLNRIPNPFNVQQTPSRFTNSQQLPAISETGQQQQQQPQQQNRTPQPQRNFAGSSRGAQFSSSPALRSPLMPPPTGAPANSNQQQLQPRPITGFAPSGPPPGSASNTAINVVQSPPNAIGQPTPQQSQHSPAMQMMTPFEMPLLMSGSNNSNSKATPASTSTTTAATTTMFASPNTSKLNPTQASTTTTTITASTDSSNAASTSDETSTTNSVPAQATTTTATTSTSSTTPEASLSDNLQEANWNPVQLKSNRTRVMTTSSLAPSPDIVTVPPGYNPDQPPPPQNYDISVSAQMGGGPPAPSASGGGGQPAQESPPPDGTSSPPVGPSSVLIASAPTETTTIIWSGETQTSSQTIAPTRTASLTIQQTRATQLPSTSQSPLVSSSTGPTNVSATPPSRIRDVMQLEEETTPADGSIIYGKSAASRNTSAEAKPKGPTAIIQTAPIDDQVRPYSASSRPLLRPNANGASSLPFKPSRPLSSAGGGGGMSVGSGFSIVASGNQTMPTSDIQDYVANAPPPIVSQSANEPTISAQGGPDPAAFDLNSEASSSIKSSHAAGSEAKQQHHQQSTSSTPAPRLRRPTFKPKSAVPPIRIDSCIVGDDSSCDQSHNERCFTEYGISSCHCKPGFARLSQLRGYCNPVSSLQFNLRIERLSDDRKLAFNQSLENPNSEEYQYLEFETTQALASALQQTSLAKQFMGARVNKFYERRNKVWANISVNLELNNLTRNEPMIQQLIQQELNKLVQQRRSQPLGDSTIVLDGSQESVSKLVDVNECASKELNDCSKHATCTNEFGGYSCQCLPGYEDKSLIAMAAANQQQQQMSEEELQAAKARQGRVCMGCSPAYCSNRGECSIVDGKKQCKCRANFMGVRCDIDSEVLAVAVGGSLVGLIILVVTFWCLFVFNRRWRREQQKMDAMSATSGLTYNYANSNNNSTNSLMTQLTGGAHNLHNPGGVSGRAATGPYSMTQRLGSAATSRLYHGHHADQQAIISSTSSGSSAVSQPIACNPYVSGYSYDEGLLIAPASTGSSEQTSPSANSYRGIMGTSGNSNHAAAMLAASSAYTLSGHHHHNHTHHAHHHLLQQQQQQQQHQMVAAAQHHLQHHHNHHQRAKQLSQFHPSALIDSYAARTLSTQSINNYCPTQPQAGNGYDSRWRTLQQADNSTTKQSSLAGYYLVR